MGFSKKLKQKQSTGQCRKCKFNLQAWYSDQNIIPSCKKITVNDTQITPSNSCLKNNELGCGSLDIRDAPVNWCSLGVPGCVYDSSGNPTSPNEELASMCGQPCQVQYSDPTVGNSKTLTGKVKLITNDDGFSPFGFTSVNGDDEKCLDINRNGFYACVTDDAPCTSPNQR